MCLGHGSARAALIYQHATSDRDLEIAHELSRLALAAREKAEQEAKDQADDQGEDGAAGVLAAVSQ